MNLFQSRTPSIFKSVMPLMFLMGEYSSSGIWVYRNAVAKSKMIASYLLVKCYNYYGFNAHSINDWSLQIEETKDINNV